MAVGGFRSHLEVADSVLDLARRLGAACLDDERELTTTRRGGAVDRELKRLRKLTGNVSLAAWEEVIADPSGFEKRFGAEVVETLKLARTLHPLDCLGMLMGLCGRALGEFFEGVVDQIGLERGMPVPFATRPLPKVLGDGCTPSLETLHNADLLTPLPYDLYDASSGGRVRVVLDFAHRDRLDELTWDEETGLPRIATIHPPGGEEFDFGEDGERFFAVRPRCWDPDAIEMLLREAAAGGAAVAVLPELSLPSPDALEELIRGNAAAIPPIVVAGSAHVEEQDGAARANESRIYLDGRFVAMARKHKAFEAKDLVPGKTLIEDLGAGQTTIMVLSGARTRLAVAICADLQETTIPGLLVAAGVNLLLVPAMTKKIGAFNASVGQVTGYRQGVAVVANTLWGDDGKPFLCLCGVPREEAAKQVGEFAGDGEVPAPTLGLLDPNLPLPDAVTWWRPDARSD